MTMMKKLIPMFTLIAAAAAGGTAAMASGTDADGAAESNERRSASEPKQDALEEITVSAQRSTPEMAREAQREAPNLIYIATAEEMQKLPDVNTGEAIRRVPGISLETDTGEGRYINIRGLDADLNSTTFGGLRLPPTNNSSPSGAGRAVAFDSIPIGFVGAIKVTKSNLPEQDAEALGRHHRHYAEDGAPQRQTVRGSETRQRRGIATPQLDRGSGGNGRIPIWGTFRWLSTLQHSGHCVRIRRTGAGSTMRRPVRRQ